MRKCLSCQTAIFRAVPCNEAIPQNTSAQPLFAISEAQILKSVQHPGIPTIYDFEEDESFYYLVEEYIQGDSLEEFLLHQQSISQNQFLYFVSSFVTFCISAYITAFSDSLSGS